MTTTTGLDLLATADQHARSLITGGAAVTLGQWEAFDDTLFRLLNTLVGPRQLGGHDPGTTRTLITDPPGLPSTDPARPLPDLQLQHRRPASRRTTRPDSPSDYEKVT